MSDPVLTTLCTICHVAAPKYKCPRCGVRTCSLPCIKKHKTWASCSGERDPASFLPREKLFTDAGVDHDYNFIHKIERAKELYEKEVLVEEAEGKGIISEKELRGPGDGREDRRFEKVWYGDQMVHEPVARDDRGGWRGRGRGGRGGGGGREAERFDQNVRRRLRKHDIEVLTMPRGLTRQKENKTAWNRRTNTINWQVEWFLYDVEAVPGEEKPKRICYKSLDEKPLYLALASTLEWYRAGLEQKKRLREDGDAVDEDAEQPPHKKRKAPTRKQKAAKEVEAMLPLQDLDHSTWPTSEYAFQCTASGQWSQMSANASLPRTRAEEDTDLARLQFYLLKPTASDGAPKGLIPLSTTTTLLEALSGRTVIEFPTIYVLASGAPLPPGQSLASSEKRKEPTISPSDDESTNGRAPGRKDRGFEMGRGFDRRGRGRGGRGGRGGHARQNWREHEEPVNGDAEDGELPGDNDDREMEGEYPESRLLAMTNMAEDDMDDAGVDTGYDRGAPEEAYETAQSKPGSRLVDYGSDSE